MNKLIRASALSCVKNKYFSTDSFPAAAQNIAIQSKKKRKWSLQTLATNNTVDNYSQNAEILLRDVNVRLAEQYEKCVEMMHQVTDIDERIKNDFHDTSRNIGKKSINSGIEEHKFDDNGRKVIRAVNQNFAANMNTIQSFNKVKQRTQRMKEIEQKQKVAIKGLRNLEILHSDTWKVCTSRSGSGDTREISYFSRC